VQHHRYSPAPEYLAKLQAAIREAHGCEADFEGTWMGVQRVGPLLWSGSVEIFRLSGDDAPAPHAFAWSKVSGGQLHCFVVPKNSAISTPEAAVRHVLAERIAQNEVTIAA
jgi:hypothetical protein